MADDGGMLTKSRLSQNPFAIKTITPTRSLADSTEGKESRPVIAPPTLKWGNDSLCSVSSSSPKVFLRPSLLAVQTEKLKSLTPTQSTVEKNESSGKDKGSRNSFIGADSFEPKPQGSSTGSSSRRSGFVFGQNLHERVVVDAEPSNANNTFDKKSELSFEAAASQKEEQEEDLKPSKSLSESAEEYQSKQIKRKFDEVTVVTGEEEESNVLQMNCKLFTFDKILSSWQERGRGFLRLNDREVDGALQSRLVMRTQGSLRVVLNTKVWLGMCVEHASQKTLRITAIDSEGVRVFLIMGNPKDVDQLFSALDWRVAMLKSQEERSGTSDCSDKIIDVAELSLPQVCDDDDESPHKRWRQTYEDPPECSVGLASSDVSSNSSFHALDES